VRRYNEALAGADWLGRTARPAPIATPPFHAVPTRGTILMTFAGLRVDDSLGVLRADGSRIDGLFAAGEALGAGQIQGAGYASGMMIVSAIVTGQGAARAAVRA
jgi:predicted oxidoreductase